MSLHRAEEPDWAKIAPEHRNIWQRLAAKTGGVITPANAISVLGAVLVGVGLYLFPDKNMGLEALTFIIIGRSFDILDGFIADKTGTKSPLGEMIDAATDKLLLLAALLVLIYSYAIPRWVGIIILLHAAYVSLLVLGKALHHKRTHPTAAGKYSTALLWAALILYIAAGGLYTDYNGVLNTLAHVVFGAYGLLGIKSSWDYTRQLRDS